MHPRWLALVLAGLLVAASAPLAAAQSPAAMAIRQLTTAAFHASELAQRGEAVAAVRLHMQHVLNCLQGARGANFNPAPGNPCQGQGGGALNDIAAAQAAGHAGADLAMREAKIAEALALQVQSQTDVIQAQAWAREIAKHLREAVKALGG